MRTLTRIGGVYTLAVGTIFDIQSMQDGDITGAQLSTNLALGLVGLASPTFAIGVTPAMLINNIYPGGFQGYYEDFFLNPDVLGNPLLGGYDGLR